MTLLRPRAALILLAQILMATTALGACTTYAPFDDQPTAPSRPAFPTRVEPAPPATTSEPVAELPLPQAQPEPGPVETQPLAPIVQPLPPPVLVYQPPPPPVMQTVTRTSVTGKVVDAEGPPKTRTIKSGDSLDAVARILGTTRQQLAEDNKLKEPYVLKPGQVLKGPASDAKAYVVGPGDTLYAVARRFSVTGQALADANDMEVGAPLTRGRKLILPDGFKDKGPTVTKLQVPVDRAFATPVIPTRSVPGTTPQNPAVAQTLTPQPEPLSPRVLPPILRVTGKVVEVPGPRLTRTVKSGDNLDAIARAWDTTRKDLAEDNKLKEPFVLQPGQVLKGPETTQKAYVVGSNDTIALVAKRFSLTPKALAAENDLKVTASIKPGRKLILPDGFKDKGPIKEIQKPVAVTPVIPPPVETPPGQFSYPRPTPQTPAPQTPRTYTAPTQTPVTPQPYSPPPNLRPSLPAPSTGGPLSDNQVTAQGRGRFNWPLRGDIISDFGPKGTGQRNDGINIRAVAGEAIRSAAAGDIVYAGDQVPGFGNLVLIKHADGWVTAYGHLARVDVKMQQRVAQGQQIGQAGTSGGVGEPQLHFEVRYAPSPTERARPVDPKLVLGR